MLNILFAIFIAPFIPVFMYGSFLHDGGLLGGQSQAVNRSVLGEERQENDWNCDDSEKSIESYNLFPFDPASSSAYTPVRKPDFRDIRIWAGSSVVVDVDSGTILEYYDGRKQTQIASLTKIMTAILTVEKVNDLDEEAVISSEALQVDGTVVGCPTSVFCNGTTMQKGERITVRSLLKAMLLNSANDAATALGIHVAGSEKKFVSMMNEKAKELGLKDTHFCTPSGLEIDGQEDQCYSSAYDIARIAAYSLKYKLIWDIMSTEEDQIASVDGKYVHNLRNTDLLLTQMPNCIGGKTGFTPMAGKSLLLAASDPTKKHKIIAVILNDENRWEDMKTLVSWVFASYDWR